MIQEASEIGQGAVAGARQGFRWFADLISQIGESHETSVKVNRLAAYFISASDADKTWALALFTGRRLRRMIGTRMLASWVSEWMQIPEWLFEECYHQVGDLAETLALLDASVEDTPVEGDLSDYMQLLLSLSDADDTQKKETVRRCWSGMMPHEKFVFNKLITGGFRVGVSGQLIIQALAKARGMEASVVAHRISGNWDPATTTFEALLEERSAGSDPSRPYPFFLAYPLEIDISELGSTEEWHAEWKWDGIRGQVIRRERQSFVWSRGEELITDRFPEFHPWMNSLPDGTVLDGEILSMRDGQPLPFSILQGRIGKKKPGPKLLKDAPAGFMAFDLLEYAGEDWREKTFIERRKKLAEIISQADSPCLKISEELHFDHWDVLRMMRRSSRDHGTEGLMLKRKSSHYQTGRRRGDWWKWKVDPMTVDAVMVYAQKGHGRRSNLYTDYTFAVKDNDRLVVFAKAYSGLTDAEFKAVDAFVKKHSIEKFGPVRTVKPELVFEIAFEGIAESKRHKSGIAVRFPRIHRWRTDKKADEIDTLETLRSLLRQEPPTT